MYDPIPDVIDGYDYLKRFVIENSKNQYMRETIDNINSERWTEDDIKELHKDILKFIKDTPPVIYCYWHHLQVKFFLDDLSFLIKTL